MFLIKANLNPKYFCSIGNVIIPTSIRVVVNAPNTMYETPSLSNKPDKGKAINPGITAIEPTIDAKKVPISSLSPPYLDKISDLTILKIPTINFSYPA